MERSQLDKMYMEYNRLIDKWKSAYIDWVYREYPDLDYDAKDKIISKYYKKLIKIGLKNLTKLNNKNFTNLDKFDTIL